MPGYRDLPERLTGDLADRVRQGQASHIEGDTGAALDILENALAACRAQGTPLPGWLCGRLAVVYRSLGRLGDEIELLEEYRASQVTDKHRTRFDARISKAKTLADRQHRQDNGALASIRQVIARPRRSGPRSAAVSLTSVFSDETRAMLRSALQTAAAERDQVMHGVLSRINAEARHAREAVDAIVALFREVRAAMAGQDDGFDGDTYSHALTLMLSVYFDGGQAQ